MAEKTQAQPHLRDLFATGKEVILDLFSAEDPDNPTQVTVWMRKPSVQHYEEATQKARAKQARRRALYKDHDSDEYLALEARMGDFETREDLIAALVAFEESNLRTQAYNLALYGDNNEDEPKWGREGQDYIDVVNALRDRYEEIQKYNEMLTPDDEDLQLDPTTDEEILRLNEIMDEFGKQKDAALAELIEEEKAKHSQKKSEELREELLKAHIKLESDLIFYQEFKMFLLYHACRMPNDHKVNYFRNPDEIWDYPDYVRVRLMNEFDELEMGADALKKLPSPQPS